MPSAKFRMFTSLLNHIEDIKETEKTKISIVYHTGNTTFYVLRVCKGRDLSQLCEALCNTRHPNIAVIYDYVYEDGDTYILEEYINGKSVKDIIDEDGPLSEKETAKIISAVCSALEVLHEKKPPIVHNDINPSNIMICDDGTVKLFDFDISRLYQKGKSQNTELFGTEDFASPEHFGYGQSEPRTDIYCLGVTMHKMLTNNVLSSEHKTTYKGKLKKIVKNCLKVDPDKRYSSVRELNKNLNRFLSKKQIIKRRIINVLCLTAVAFCCFFVFKIIDVKEILSPIDDEKNTAVTLSENKEPENTTAFTENENITNQGLTPNNTRATALTIALEQKLNSGCDGIEPEWFKFSTSGNNSVYRIKVTSVEIPQHTNLEVALYDDVGIKLNGFNVYDDQEFGFIDLNLQPDTEYFVKINSDDKGVCCTYEVLISESVCDAGLDKETAKEIVVGERTFATLDSTLSDWYVFRVPHEVEYTYTIHNIDVGCEISFAKHSLNGGRTSSNIPNEDNYSGVISNVSAGELIYFEIYPTFENPKANGNYIIEIKEAN